MTRAPRSRSRRINASHLPLPSPNKVSTSAFDQTISSSSPCRNLATPTNIVKDFLLAPHAFSSEVNISSDHDPSITMRELPRRIRTFLLEGQIDQSSERLEPAFYAFDAGNILLCSIILEGCEARGAGYLHSNHQASKLFLLFSSYRDRVRFRKNKPFLSFGFVKHEHHVTTPSLRETNLRSCPRIYVIPAHTSPLPDVVLVLLSVYSSGYSFRTRKTVVTPWRG